MGPCCTRRAFLGRASAGLGTMALASLLNPAGTMASRSASAGQPRHGQSLALSAQGEAGDLALPVGRPDAPGNLRQQAAIGQAPRPADARFVHQGPADRPASRGQAELFRTRSSASSGSASRGRRFARCFPIWLDRRRDVHHPLDEDRGHQPRPGPHLHEYRLDHLRPAGGRAPGRFTVWAARTRTCPASSC